MANDLPTWEEITDSPTALTDLWKEIEDLSLKFYMADLLLTPRRAVERAAGFIRGRYESMRELNLKEIPRV
jgi:hypothetical protein